jgi:type II secretory pathway pseudopilin PulG
VTLALVAVIVSIGAPVVASAKRKARITACASQQRELYLAVDGFVGDRGRLPRYGDTATSYLDVLEGQRVDGEFGRFLRNYAGVDTVAESSMLDGEGTQLAVGDWATSLLHCPAASFQRKWWYEKYHHAMAPWETLDYRFSGLDLYDGEDSPFGDRQLGRMADPLRVVFLQDNALDAKAQRMHEIFGQARANNHRYAGLNVMYADGGTRWTSMRETTTLAAVGEETGGYYRTSQPVDGQVQWWQSELHVVPTAAYNTAPGLRVYNPDGLLGHGKLRHYAYSTPRSRSRYAAELLADARALGYSLPADRDDERRRRDPND